MKKVKKISIKGASMIRLRDIPTKKHSHNTESPTGNKGKEVKEIEGNEKD